MLLFSVVLIYFFDDLFSKISFVLIRYEVHLILRFAREKRLFVSFLFILAVQTISFNSIYIFSHLHSWIVAHTGKLYFISLNSKQPICSSLFCCTVWEICSFFFNGKLIKIGDLLRNLFACAIFIQFLIECIRCQSVMHQKWNDAWPEKKITLTPRLN